MSKASVVWMVVLLIPVACGGGNQGLGDAGPVPEVDGFEVLCSGGDDGGSAWYAMLEGPAMGSEEYEAVVAPYAGYLGEAGFELAPPTEVDHDPGWLRVEGVRSDAAVSVTVTNTVHSTLIVLAWAASPEGFTDLGRVATDNGDCYGRIGGIITQEELTGST